jgi:hypothetical protein
MAKRTTYILGGVTLVLGALYFFYKNKNTENKTTIDKFQLRTDFTYGDLRRTDRKIEVHSSPESFLYMEFNPLGSVVNDERKSGQWTSISLLNISAFKVISVYSQSDAYNLKHKIFNNKEDYKVYF